LKYKKIEKKKKKKGWQLGKSKPKKVLNAWRNQIEILDKIKSPIVPQQT
jgi:hypothetical protein